jgi:hypothetical protein
MNDTVSIRTGSDPRGVRRLGHELRNKTPRRRVYVNFNSKMPQSRKLCFIITWEGLGRPSSLCTQNEANAFPFEIIIWDTKVF